MLRCAYISRLVSCGFDKETRHCIRESIGIPTTDRRDTAELCGYVATRPSSPVSPLVTQKRQLGYLSDFTLRVGGQMSKLYAYLQFGPSYFAVSINVFLHAQRLVIYHFL
jgi:hypothetical protein